MSASAEVICGKDNESIGATVNVASAKYSDYGSLVVCHNDKGGVHANNITISDVDYMLVYKNDKASALSCTFTLRINDCSSVIFRNNISTEEYTSDVTGVKALAGGGAISSGCEFQNVDHLFFSGNQATKGVGGAIDGDGSYVSILNCKEVTFKDNYAKIGGGAIGLYGHSKGWFGEHNHWFQIRYADSVSFYDNRAGEIGGAIHAKYLYLNDNKGTIVFSGNTAENYGGAIYLDSYTGYESKSWRTLYLHGNEEVVFRDNSAGVFGGAIYAASTKGTAYIANNAKVAFENNDGGAIYAKSCVQIQGNEHVCFRGNGTAIDAVGVYLSTTANEASTVQLYDSLISRNHLYLNTLTPQYNVEGGSANGSVLFIGEMSHSTVAQSVTLGSGVARIEQGATLSAGTSLAINGGQFIVAQHETELTALTIGSNLSFGSNAGILAFELKYNDETTTPLVEVGGTVTLSSGCLEVEGYANGVSAYLSDIALLKIGGQIKYDGRTYTYSNGNWFCTMNNSSYALPLDEILSSTTTTKDKSALEWRDGTLYYTQGIFDEWTGIVKGLNKAETWRGDTMKWYDANKNRVYVDGRERDGTCWVVVAANMIQYWQDKYAPLYQGPGLITDQVGVDRKASLVYQSLSGNLKNKDDGGYVNESLGWWLLNAPSARRFQNTKEVNNWPALGFTSEHIVDVMLNHPNCETMFSEFTRAFQLSETGFALGLDFYDVNSQTGSIVNPRNPNGRHVVTVWEATFKEIKDNGEIEQAIEIKYTDSDWGKSDLATMVIKFSPEYGAYIASDYLYDDSNPNKNRIKLVSQVTYLKTPSGLDEMLEDYYNDKTLHWTGWAEGGKWDSSSKMIGSKHHLATPADGWQKECTGGGKTIYAHAYFTEAEESKMNFVFDSQVGTSGKLVWNRVVQIDDDLKVGSVLVNADYHFGGHGSLKAKEIGISGNLTIGSFDRIWGSEHGNVGGNFTIHGTPITVSGSLTLAQLDKSYATLQGCDVTLSGGTLWCGGMKLARTDEFGDVVLGSREYNVLESNMQMQSGSLSVQGSGTLGCAIDLEGNVLDYATWAVSDKSDLNRLFFYYVASNNVAVQGDVDTYQYKYKLTDANIESNADTLKETPLFLSDSVLTLTPGSESTEALTLGSSTGNLGESAAEILLDESGAVSIAADEVPLMTMPTEETYLGSGTSITTPELLVSGTSTLTNAGRISGGIVVEEDAMLRGSGTFAGTTVQAGGSLMVGSSPGAPVYEALTLQSGSELIFCVDGTTAATAEKQGWGSGTHSLLTVTDAAGLTVEAGTVVNVGCSLDFLNASELGEEQTLTLVQLSGEAGADLLAALQSGTQFKLANADDSMEELSTVGALVHSAAWSQGSDNTLTLSFIVSSMMEDALVWSNASADGKWNASSLNWSGESPYADGCNVAFYQGGSVEIEPDITPGDMLVSTSDDMRWSGAGSIAGDGSLTKEGRGELRIEMSNADYAGHVLVRGGTLTAAADEALGSAWIDVNNATLDLGDKASNNTVRVYGESTLRGASGLKHVTLTSGAELTSPDGWSVGADASLTSLGAATYVGDLTLDGGVVVLGGLMTIDGNLVFAQESCTTLDVSDSSFKSYGSYTLAPSREKSSG